jgi:hypothetical protein
MPSTMFSYIKGVVSNGNDLGPEQSSDFLYPPMSAYHNVTVYRRETITLDAAGARSVTLPAYVATSCVGFWARITGTDGVPGEARLTTVGTDWDGVTAITGETAGYGTDKHPGYISAITENVTTFTLTGLADGTQVEYLIGIIVQDDQL